MTNYLPTAGAVLATCAGADPWFPKANRSTVASWARTFERSNIDPALLLDAAVALYDDRCGDAPRVLAGDVVLRARAIRADRASRRSPTELPSGEPCDPAAAKKHLDTIRAEIARRAAEKARRDTETGDTPNVPPRDNQGPETVDAA